MLSDQFPIMKNSSANLLDNVTLAILEYILEEGIDGALAKYKGVTEEEIRVFPHVVQALRERGYLASKKPDIN